MGVSLPILGVPGPLDGGLASPDTVSNLKHWYNLDSLGRLFQDAAMTTPVASDGDPVGAWVCQIVAADEIAQSTAGARPTYKASVAAFNNKPALQFDGGDFLRGALTAATTQPTTFFIVSKRNSGTDFYICDGDDGANRNALFSDATKYRYFSSAIINGAVLDTTVDIHAMVFNGASSAMHINGAASASGNAGTAVIDGLTLGAKNDSTSHFTGYIAECLIYNGLLTIADKNLVQNYLAAKYAISVTVFS